MEITDIQKLGIGLGGFGVFFLLLGVMLFFDTGLLAIGNLFCIAGTQIFLKTNTVNHIICLFRTNTGDWYREVDKILCTT